jgi:Tol biopolymer transport system component
VIVGPIGAGGMGEVYRARDSRLGRDVAIKVLPTAAALDPDRLARFDREARLLASLNHPHIATIHGIEHSDGVRGLVLELVEGETLADIIARGPVPLREALRLAGQIADALDAAHAKGVIHRDLKPANIKVTPERQIKVLDFGLAKAFAPSELDADVSAQPTVTSAGTREGLVVGTAAYMSPEQARGLSIDKRTDIWAFGCVLYEMLTGRLAFAAGTMSDTIAAVLQREPDWSALPSSLPPEVARLLRRCLEKDVARRLRDIGNTRADLDESGAAGAPPASAATRPIRASGWMVWLPTAAAVILAMLLIAQLAGLFQSAAPSTPPAAPVSRFVETVIGGLQLAPAPALALTADGRRLAYVAMQDGARTLYVRDLDDVTARPLAGTQDADQPFFSPDGGWIAFFAESKLKKVAVAGGAPITIAPVANPRGGTWLPDNTIIFAPSAASVLMRVSAEGGKAEPASTLDRQLNEASHRWPHALPGGDAIVYSAGPTVSTREWMEAHVVAQAVSSSSPAGTPAGSRRRVVAPHGSFPHFVSSRHLLYAQSGLVYGQAFDPKTFQTTGDAFPILERITSGATTNGGSLILAISPAGTIAYAPGFDRQADVVLLDRSGKERVVMPAGSYFMPRLSPDGRLIALSVASGTDSDVWIHDIDRGATTKLTSGGRNLWPIWSPDGTRVAYASSREGSTNVYWRRADGSDAEEQLTTSAHTVIPQSWAPDGRLLVVTNVQPDHPNYVALLPTAGPHTIQRFQTGDTHASLGSLSADGHWMAYVSAESGRLDVYVRPYPGPGPALQISTSGGDEPCWAGRGLELLFRRGETLFSVNLTTSGGHLTAGAATPVFTGRIAAGGVRTGYDVSADGRTLVFAKLRQPRENLSQFVVLLNALHTIRPATSRQ